MARLRKFVAYRRLERPYTRKSKYRNKSFVRTSPNKRITKFVMGDSNKKFEFKLRLVSKTDLQIRDNALESSRLSTNRFLEKLLTPVDFFYQVNVYPHHMLRENPLASGAGADRMSTGMAAAFGKIIGIAARVKKGDTIFTIKCNKNHVDVAKKALKRAATKLPNSYTVVVEEIK